MNKVSNLPYTYSRYSYSFIYHRTNFLIRYIHPILLLITCWFTRPSRGSEPQNELPVSITENE